MSPLTIGLIGIIAFVVLMFLKVPIGFAMALVGFVGIMVIEGVSQGLSTLELVPFRETASYILSSLPLFILLGYIATDTGLCGDFFEAVNKWIGHIRGGMGVSIVAACTAFAAMCGDMISSAVTMGLVAVPQMRKLNYSDQLILGSIAAGGNLSILIPPSIPLIIYAVLTDLSIGQLFMAGLVPGLLMALFFVFTVLIVCRINPKLATVGAKASWTERMKSLRLVWPFLVLILLILGGIYAGIFTPTESAAVGVFGATILGLIKRGLTWKGVANSLSMTASLTGMVFVLLIGAMVFARFVTVAQLNLALTNFIEQMALAPWIVLASILLFYIVVGFFLNIMGIIILTIPVLHPILVGLGFDPLWLAVLVVVTATMGNITPPFGIVIFALSATFKDVPLLTIYRGSFPFFYAMCATMALVIAFPIITTFLPHLMYITS